MKFTDRVRSRLGMETSTERSLWAGRLDLIKSTVMVNYWDESLWSAIRNEYELLKAALPKEEYDAIPLYEVEERVRLKALCAARCALPVTGVQMPILREMGFDFNKGRGLGPVLKIVGFPEDWTIDPMPDLRSPHAVVADTVGAPRLTVFYQHSIQAENPGQGHVELIR